MIEVEAQAVPRPPSQNQSCIHGLALFLSKTKAIFSRGNSNRVIAPQRPLSRTPAICSPLGLPNTAIVEDLPEGYPRFATLIGQDVAFQISRRFSVARSRLLLRKQDAVLQLQQRLEELDKNETRPLFLASFRRDKNTEREEVLNNLDAALADYGKWRLLLSRTGELTRPRCTIGEECKSGSTADPDAKAYDEFVKLVE
jgi:hypothetical protein